MRFLPRVVLVGLAVLSAALGHLAPAGASETSPQQVTVVSSGAGATCEGDPVTVVWSPPADVAGLIGYRVVREVTTMNPPWIFTDEVRADQTSLGFAAPFGLTLISVYTKTAEGTASNPFATGSLFAGRPPQPMQWTGEGAGVGDGTATVPFRWFGLVKLFTTGGLPTTVRVTASPGGATMDLEGVPGVTGVFEGLTNGVGYTFSAVTFNECGSSAGGPSPTYTPGVGPAWTRATPPPTTTPSGGYVYKFAADGDPSPTYRLVDAPSWLSISPKGLLSGRPPFGTQSFSYSVVASNGVGIASYRNSDVVAGPYTVSISSPRLT